MNVLDSYACEKQVLENLINRQMVVGDRVNLPDGIYTTEQDSFAAVVLSRKFVAELEIYDEYGESKS